MKIIFTTHTYYPGKDGVAIVNDYLTKGLADKGYNVLIITHEYSNSEWNSKVSDNGDLEYYHGIDICRVYDGDNDKYIKYIKSILDEEDVLVNVCTQTPTTDALLPYLHALKCRKKILYVHGIWNFKWDNRNKESFHNIASKVYNNAKWWWYYHKLGKYINEYDTVTQLHEMDYGNIYFRKHYGIDSVIMENAADDAFFEKADDSKIMAKYNLPHEYMI